MITILFLLTAIIATIAVTIATAIVLTVLAAHFSLTRDAALRGFYMMSRAYEYVVVENTYFRRLITASQSSKDVAVDETEPLFVPKWSDTLH